MFNFCITGNCSNSVYCIPAYLDIIIKLTETLYPRLGIIVLLNFLDELPDSSTNLVPCTVNKLSNWLEHADQKTQTWLEKINFKSEAKSIRQILFSNV